METIGFIGLGTMGSPMTANLMKAGHSLVVMDISSSAGADLSAAGARRVDKPEQVAEAADIVFLSLPGPDQVREVTLSIAPSLRSGSVVVDTSTCGPPLARELAAALAGRGAQFVDAPITGGAGGARHATLKVMVGADEALFERLSPLLQVFGKEVFRMGPCGAGYATKLVNNALHIDRMAAAIEGLELARAAGVDMAAMEAILTSRELLVPPTGGGGTTEGLYNFFRSTKTIGAKDARLAMELAQELDVPWDIGGRVAGMFGRERP